MSYLFLLFATLSLYSLSNKINRYVHKNNENVIVDTFIFSFLFVLIYLLSSYLFLLNISSKYFAYIFLIIVILVIYSQWREILKYFKIFKLKLFSNNKLLILILIFYSFIIFFPPSDEDSLRYHLAIAKKINNGSFYSNVWFDYITIGSQEFLSSFLLHLNLENFISYSNFLYLAFAIISNIFILKKYNKGSGFLSATILISSPYLIALLASQKFYFFPCFIVSYSIAYLYLDKEKNLFTIYLVLFLNVFCVISKAIFLPYLILIIIWLFFIIKGNKNKIIYLFSTLFTVIVLYFPIFFIKLKIFNDPFLPYISLNSSNFDWFADFNFNLTNWNMDYTDKIKNMYLKSFLIPFKLIFPLTVSDFFKTLGISLLFLFSFDFKKNKNLLYILIFFILSVVVLNNYQTRWFLPLLLFTSIFARINKYSFLKKINLIQLSLVSCLIFSLGLISIISHVGLLDKKIILNKIVSSTKVVEKINKKYKNHKFFSDLNNQYYFSNSIPIYYPKQVNKFDKNYYKRNEPEAKFIIYTGKYGDIKLLLSRYFDCQTYEKIEEYYYLNRRFYFIAQKKKVNLYRLTC